MRDYQRKKVYDSERFHSLWLLLKFRNFNETQKYVNNILDNEETHKASFRLKDGRGCRHARATDSTITLPRWARFPLVVLHELAHVFTDDKHGPKFCAEYIRLVDEYLGVDDAIELMYAFDKHGVDY
jgi:putative metallohydrolase (TIGR04338 family)